MSIAEKFEVIADAVYEKGKTDEHDRFWDAVQKNGTRTNYQYAFRYWGSEYIQPKYKVIPTATGSSSNLFSYNSMLKKVESTYFDLSQITVGTNVSNGHYMTFNSCGNLEEIEDIGMYPNFSYNATFAYCSKLKKLAVFRVSESITYAGTFSGCVELENITVEGTIGQSGFNVKDCTKLTTASLLSILTALSKDSTTASGKSITFATVHQEAIEGDEQCLEQLNLAVSAGWTVAYA